MLRTFFFFFFEILLELIEQGEQWNYKLKKKIEKKESGTVATNYIPQKMGLHSFGNSIFFAFFKQLVWIVIIIVIILMGNSFFIFLRKF